MTRRTMTRIGVALVVLLAAAGCSEPEPKTDQATGDTSTATSKSCAGTALLACARKSTIGAFVPAKPTKATGTPIKLGMINQENTAAGSFPELSQAVQAGIRFVNEQLGGIDGHPLELEICNTEFSAEGSTTCGQTFVEEEVPAVLGGIDVFGNGIDTLDANGIPYVGGIPVSTQSAVSPNSFQWSGGTWGAAVAFADYAHRVLEAKKVAIVYGEFGSISQSAEYAEKVLTDDGVTVQLVPYPILSTDITSPLHAAIAGKPDAIMVLAADTGCKPALEGIKASGTEAATFYVGACAAPSIIGDVPVDASEGAIFNVEGEIDRKNPSPDSSLYTAVINRYGRGLDPIGAGTVSFRSFMNLYVVLSELGADDVSAKAISEALSAKKDATSFMGHNYTCDRKQFEGLPALCSPQQILGVMKARNLFQVGTWIDVGQVYAG